jgi:hypothetical protein
MHRGCSLYIQVEGEHVCAHLIPRAFPALRHLTLTRAQLGDGALFDILAMQPSPALASLKLIDSTINSAAVPYAAAALARLPCLNSLHLETTCEGGQGQVPLALGAQVTGLTSLVHRACKREPYGDSALIKVATNNTGLRRLEMSCAYNRDVVYAGALRPILTRCTGLTYLSIVDRQINDSGLDVLLKYGTSITDLTLGASKVKVDRAHRQCSWQRLTLHSYTLHQLAYLPLRAVQSINLQHFGNDMPNKLELPLDRLTPAQAVSLLQQAAANLAACPSWQQSPAGEIELSSDSSFSVPEADHRVQLLQALAPLGGRHGLKLRMGVAMQLGAREAEAIARSLGVNLWSLTIYSGTLLSDFWRGLSHHLPGLPSLSLEDDVKTCATDIAVFLISHSSTRTAREKLLMCIHSGVLERAAGEQLEMSINTWQLGNIDLSVLQSYHEEQEEEGEEDGEEGDDESDDSQEGSDSEDGDEGEGDSEGSEEAD